MMIDETYNPTDPAFLASRALDESLTIEEQSVLDRALAESPALRAEVERLRRASELVGQWAKEAVEIDWETHAKLIAAKVVSDQNTDGDDLSAVDGLLGAWGSQSVALDEDAFTASVLERIAPAESLRPWRLSRMIYRVGATFAAAAVLVLAVSIQFWPTGLPDVVSVVTIGPIAGMREDVARRDEETPRSVVSFSRVETRASTSSPGHSSFRFVSIGVSPHVEVAEDASPL